MKTAFKHLLICFLVLCMMLPMLPVPTDAASTVVYDASKIKYFQRTPEEVAAKYEEAIAVGAGITNFYDRKPSLQKPYDQGVLKQQTLDAMIAMTNYLRWLVGSKPLQEGAAKNDEMQRAALIRNFDFNHFVDPSKKPSDMSQDLWDSGANVWHNIIAWNYSPLDAIQQWCNEGYQLSSGTWGTTGHRSAIIGATVSKLLLGYAGHVGVGLVAGDSNDFQVPFVAFPAPGPMPTDIIKADRSSWTFELNYELFSIEDFSKMSVTVTNAATGKSYTCTAANNKLTYEEFFGILFGFVQPSANGQSYTPGSVYKIVVKGLTDKATGNAAELRYQVEFFDKNQPTPPPFRFDDVKDPKAYYYDAVYWAFSHKPYQVTAGIDKTHFGPNQTVTRAQAMTFFWAAKDRPKFKKASTQFVDVKKTDWYYKSVMWAVEKGITAGTDVTHFSPNKTCNRGEILTFLYAAMNKPKVKIKNPYKDVSNQWYKKAALWAYEYRIEKGEKGKFNASTPCTRGSVVTYLYRFLERKSLLD